MANILPPGKQQFLDADGKPLAAGQVFSYTPGTTDFKDTYQNADATILNTNPIVLDAAGEAVIFGTGAYRQVLQDAGGNPIWDQETSEPGSQISDTAVSGDLSVTGAATFNGVTIAGSTDTVDISATGNVHVTGAFAADGLTSLNGTTNTADLNVGGPLTVFDNATVTGDIGADNLTATGNVGAATMSVSGTFSGTTSGWQMNPSGTGIFTAGSFNLGINSGGGVLGTTFIAASDARVKTEIEDVPFAEAVRFMRTMRARVFLKDGTPDAGFIAQDAITNGFQRMVIMSDTADPRMQEGDAVSPVGKRLNLNYNYAIACHHRMVDFLLDRVEDLQKQIELLKN